MTMDLIPKSSKATGEGHFTTRAWCGLWRYCETIAPTITSKVKSAYSNDGSKVGARDAKALAAVIDAEIANGNARRYFDTETAKRLEWGIWGQFETLGKMSEFFRTSGGFEIW